MKRAILIGTGWCCVLVALAGAVLPVLPCTPFVLLAATCFAHSSPRAKHRLRRMPLLGKVLRDWEQHRGMRPPAKVAALCLAIAAPLITVTLNPQFSLPLLISTLGGLVAITVVFRLPTVLAPRIDADPEPTEAPIKKRSRREKLARAA